MGGRADPDAPAPGQGKARLDAGLRRSIAAVALSGAALSAAALAVRGPKGALSVAVGAGLATGNLWLLARIVVAITGRGSDGSAGGAATWAALAFLKMLALLAAVWLLMRSALVSPLLMLVGFGALPIGVAIGALVSDRAPPQNQ